MISKGLKGRFYLLLIVEETSMAFKKFEGPSRGGFAPREMVKGNWKCADCGIEITELPFQPAPDRPIYCKECWAKRRSERFRR